MKLTPKDLAIVERFNFNTQPVGVKFLTRAPADIQRLDEKLALCEMLKQAPARDPFFVDAQNHTCEAGLYVLGQADAPAQFASGEFGAGLQIFDGPRAASRIYAYIPTIARGTINCVAFSPIDKLSFDPDLLILLADSGQTEIILRAMSYRTGEMWSNRYSAAIGCAWLFIYPYLSGKLNYAITGLGHGMKRRKLFPEGRQLISIPFDMLPSMLQTLQEMPWELPAYKPDGMAFVRNLLVKLGLPPPT